MQVVPCDPGPPLMCINCLSRLENWEKFKKICISSNECIQDYIKQLEEEKSNSMIADFAMTFTEEPEADKQVDTYASTFSNKLNNQDSDDDSSKSKLPVLITVIQLLLVIIIGLYKCVIF